MSEAALQSYIEIRPATLSDVDGIAALGLEALGNPDGLRVSREKVYEAARECISSRTNYAGVVVQDGEVVGALCAFVHELMFFERKQASVIQFYCKAPGEGIKLIRDFLAWARSRPMIKMIAFTLECDADPRIGKLLQRLGFDEEMPVWAYTKGKSARGPICPR